MTSELESGLIQFARRTDCAAGQRTDTERKMGREGSLNFDLPNAFPVHIMALVMASPVIR